MYIDTYVCMYIYRYTLARHAAEFVRSQLLVYRSTCICVYIDTTLRMWIDTYLFVYK